MRFGFDFIYLVRFVFDRKLWIVFFVSFFLFIVVCFVFLCVFDRIMILKLYYVILWFVCLFVFDNGIFFLFKFSIGFYFRDWYNYMNCLIM